MKNQTNRKFVSFSKSAGCPYLRRWLAVAILLPATFSYAEGFRNPPPGSFNLGRAGGRIAQVDDSSAVQQNPANLVDMTNAQVQLTPTVVYISAEFTSPNGQSANSINPWKVLPNFFASMPLENDKFSVGLGITMPYGLGSEWDTGSSAFSQPGGVLTYTAPYYSKLTTLNFNPTIAAKLGEDVSVGVGLDVMWSELEFKQYLSPALPNLQAQAQGDGVGYGANLGITWQVTERQRLSATYRSPLTVHYNGNTDFQNYPGIPSTSFSSKITFPTIVGLGYGFQATDKIRLETDFEWIEFSKFSSLPVNVGNNVLGVPPQQIDQGWKNTFTAGCGGDWQFTENWVFRAGYQFYETPVPNSTFTPTIPDANQNVITFGIGWKGEHSSLEFAYGLDFYNKRTIANSQTPAYDGTYTFNVHLFSFAYRYSF